MNTYIIGDVHGCLEELDSLISIISPARNDSFVFLGDIVDKGPFSAETVSYVQSILRRFPGSVCLCGNHEDSSLKHPRDWSHRVDQLWLASLPLIHRIGHFTFVHGGIHPAALPIGEVTGDWRRIPGSRGSHLRGMLRTRFINPANGHRVQTGLESDQHIHWSDWYSGQEGFVIYGHDPSCTPRVGRHSLGIDTGCVFGGQLSACLLASLKIVGVPAKTAYAEPYNSKPTT